MDSWKETYVIGRRNTTSVEQTNTKNGSNKHEIQCLGHYGTKSPHHLQTTFVFRSPPTSDMLSHVVPYQENETKYEKTSLIFGFSRSCCTICIQTYLFVTKPFCNVITRIARATPRSQKAISFSITCVSLENNCIFFVLKNRNPTIKSFLLVSQCFEQRS